MFKYFLKAVNLFSQNIVNPIYLTGCISSSCLWSLNSFSSADGKMDIQYSTYLSFNEKRVVLVIQGILNCLKQI